MNRYLVVILPTFCWSQSRKTPAQGPLLRMAGILSLASLLGAAGCSEPGAETSTNPAPNNARQATYADADADAAQGCFPDRQYSQFERFQPGIITETSHREQRPAQPGTEYTTTTETIGPAVFEGVDVIEQVVRFSNAPGQRRHFIAFDDESNEGHLVGATEETDTGSHTTTYEPHKLKFRDGPIGSERTQTLVERSRTDTGDGTPPVESVVEQVISFEKIETVIVPAGTFEACRIVIERCQNGEHERSCNYLAIWNEREHGIGVLQLGSTTEDFATIEVRSELISATVDGRPVTGFSP